MAKILGGFLVNATAFFAADLLLGERMLIPQWVSLAFLSVVFGCLNTFVMPILKLLTLPIRILTLGFFTFVLNGSLLYLVSLLYPQHLQFASPAILHAVLASMLLSLAGLLLGWMAK